MRCSKHDLLENMADMPLFLQLDISINNNMSSLTPYSRAERNSLTITIHEDDQLVYSIYDVGGMFTLRTNDLSTVENGSTFQLQVTLNNMLSRKDNPCDPNNG